MRGGRRRIARKSISWTNSFVQPPLASRTAVVSRRSPGTKRSWPMRNNGPLGTSRIPVASTTIAPGRPAAKRVYHSITSSVTKPSSVARQGTMAGTQVRWRRERLPASRGENRRERAASSMVGIRPCAGAKWMR